MNPGRHARAIDQENSCRPTRMPDTRRRSISQPDRAPKKLRLAASCCLAGNLQVSENKRVVLPSSPASFGPRCYPRPLRRALHPSVLASLERLAVVHFFCCIARGIIGPIFAISKVSAETQGRTAPAT